MLQPNTLQTQQLLTSSAASANTYHQSNDSTSSPSETSSYADEVQFVFRSKTNNASQKRAHQGKRHIFSVQTDKNRVCQKLEKQAQYNRQKNRAAIIQNRRKLASESTSSDGGVSASSFVERNSIWPISSLPYQIELACNLIKTGEQLLDKQTILTGLQQLLDILGSDSIIQAVPIVIDSGIVANLKTFLEQNKIQTKDDLNIMMIVVWIFVNLSVGHMTSLRRLEHQGMIETLKIAYIKFTFVHGSLGGQILWALSNFVLERKNYRDSIIGNSFVKLAVQVYDSSKQKQELLPDLVYFLTNCMRIQPYPMFTQVKHGLILMVTQLKEICANLGQETVSKEKNHILYEILAGLKITAEVNASYIDIFFHGADLYEPLVSILKSQVKKEVQLEAMQLIGVLCGKEKCSHVTEFINQDICGCLQIILTDGKPKSALRNVIYFLISNIAADKDNNAIQSLIDSGLISTLNFACQFRFQKLQKHPDRLKNMRQLKEILYAVCNCFQSPQFSQVDQLLKLGALATMFMGLKCQDQSGEANAVSLTALLNIFELARKEAYNTGVGQVPLLDQFKQEGGLEILESLQEHPCNAVYEISFQILEKYFGQDIDNSIEQMFA